MRLDDTVARIRSRRASRPTRKRIPPAQQPDSIRREYFAALKRITDWMAALLAERLGPVLERVARDDGLRVDAPAGDGSSGDPPVNPGPSIRGAIREVAEQMAAEFPSERLVELAGRIAESTSAFQKRQWINQVKAVIGVDPTRSEPWLHGSIREFSRLNAGLIKSVPFQALGDIEQHVTAAAMGGARHETLAKLLQERMGVSESRAKLIARDQVGKFYGSLAQTRQREAGVTKYTWRTAHDNRVREEHEALDGKVFDWSSPPAEGHPGEAIQCRCSAEPDLSEALKFGPDAPQFPDEDAPVITADPPTPRLPEFDQPVTPITESPPPTELAPPADLEPAPLAHPPGLWPKKMPAEQAHAWNAAGFTYDPATKKFTSPGGWTAGVPTKPTSLPPTKPPPKKKAQATAIVIPPPPPPPVVVAPPPKPFQTFGAENQQKKQFAAVLVPQPDGFYWHPSAGTWSKDPDPIYGPGGSHVAHTPKTFVFSEAGLKAAQAKATQAAASVPAKGTGAVYDGSHVPGADKYKRLTPADYNAQQTRYREEWWPSLGSNEQAAVTRYTGGDYGLLNRQLRGVSAWTKDGERFRDRLDHAYAKTPPLSEPVVVYRGMGAEILDQQIKGWRMLTDLSDLVGASVNSANFMSTAGLPGSEFPGELKMRIRLPQGTRRAAFIRDWSLHKSEDEVLLSRNTEMRIVNAERVNGKVVLDVELVPKIPPDEPGTSH